MPLRKKKTKLKMQTTDGLKKKYNTYNYLTKDLYPLDIKEVYKSGIKRQRTH